MTDVGDAQTCTLAGSCLFFLSEMPPAVLQELLLNFHPLGVRKRVGTHTPDKLCSVPRPWAVVFVCVCACARTLVNTCGVGSESKLVPMAPSNSCGHFINDLIHILHMRKECTVTCFSSLSASRFPAASAAHNSSSRDPGPARRPVPPKQMAGSAAFDACFCRRPSEQFPAALAGMCFTFLVKAQEECRLATEASPPPDQGLHQRLWVQRHRHFISLEN